MLCYAGGSVRNVRQHVNPLGAMYLDVRAEAIASPPTAARVEVELGCADGKFSFELAERHPDWFVVGLEIREALVDRNRELAGRLGLANLAFGYSNINVDLDRVFAPASVDRFHVLFPDPWFKARHRKRRVVDQGLVRGAGVERPTDFVRQQRRHISHECGANRGSVSGRRLNECLLESAPGGCGCDIPGGGAGHGVRRSSVSASDLGVDFPHGPVFQCIHAVNRQRSRRHGDACAFSSK